MGTVRIEDRDGVAVVTLDDGKANTLGSGMLRQLRETAEQLAGGRGGVVLTGAGRFFSAGLDLAEVGSMGRDGIGEILDLVDGMCRDWFAMPRPVVCAVNGHAIAGGAILALAGDGRLAARGEYKLGLTEIALGIPFPGVALEVVRYRVGSAYRDRVILQGELFGPDAAAAAGLVERVTEPDRLIDEAVSLAARLARAPGVAFAHTKKSLLAASLARMQSEQDAHREAFLDALARPDVQAHIRATLEAMKARKK
ncbi:MAG: enoyl-CoA hydratase/isomerase family protein [Candidatus Wallbacteria bacterium]|nr:enoyl-CoA hydratase/isomerase family protein [Candidatus Wallbacteria bacterium]MBI4868707.1 enoyl-CoA hydratase/isomerase family protein [Candidatus Wallbacteria bacterium]